MTFVRPAERDDLPVLKAFDQWKRTTIEVIDRGEVHVAGHDAVVQAYGILNRAFFSRPFIDTVFVHAEHRRTGLGSMLLEHLERVAEGPQLWVSTNIENLAMQQTLQKRRYRLCGVVNELADLPELVYVKSI